MSTPGDRPARPGVPEPSRRRLLVLVCGATLLTSINFSLIFVAFGSIEDSFRADPSVVAWALTGFSITTAALLMPAGWLADRFGRERMFLSGLALFTVGSLMVAASPVVWVLLVGRVLQASGLVVESAAALPILLDAYPTSMRATIVGAIGAAGGAAAAIGPVIGGALVDTVGWRGTFALNVPLGILLCVVVRRNLPMRPPRPAAAAPDVLGIAALAFGMAAIVLAITRAPTWGLTSASTLAAVVAGTAALGLVVRRSGRHPDPVLYLPLLREPTFRQGALLNATVAGTFAGTFFTFIRLLTEGWGLSVFGAGIAVALVPLLGGPLSIVAGRIADRRGPRTVIVPGALLITTAGVLLALGVSPERNLVGLWLPVASIYGVGVGLAHAACHAAALRRVGADRLGIGGSMSRLAMEVGGIITVAVAVALVAAADDPIAGVRRISFLVSGVCALAALYALRLGPHTPLPTTVSEPGAVPAPPQRGDGSDG